MKYEIYPLNRLFPELPKVDFSGYEEKKSKYGFASDEDILKEVNAEPTLAAYCLDNYREIDARRLRPAVLICPGGGYRRTSDREAEPVAMQFLARGYNCFILEYTTAFARFPVSLLQLAASVRYLRENSEWFHIDPGKIAVCGFSAGGHLAASLGVFWKEPLVAGAPCVAASDVRPNALILCYPVITSGTFVHRDSFRYLLGDAPDPDLLEKLSLEKQVHGGVPPVFLWHTFEDRLVPVENTLLFADALRKNRVPFELHIFPAGMHGLSLATEEVGPAETYADAHVARWVPLCDEWLKLCF